MSTLFTIEAEKRSENIKPRQLRRDGKIPATIYGKGLAPISIQLDTKTFDYNLKRKPETLELLLDGETIPVVIQHVQRVFTTDQSLNVEFKRI
jgi:large subunit ribosomal protein L25